MKFKTFLILCIDFSLPSIKINSNAPGENSSPDKATLTGHNTCQFFISAFLISSTKIFLISSIFSKSLFLALNISSANCNHFLTMSRFSIFIFGFIRSDFLSSFISKSL